MPAKNDLKFAFRQLLKNSGFTVHPPQYRGATQVGIPHSDYRGPNYARRCCYGGRAAAVLTLALGIGANMAVSNMTHP